MTITKLAFQFFMMNIEHKMKLKLTIVIGFGAKIWIQSPNLFQKFQQVWRQLHSLSIVDYPNFQCSRLFLGQSSCLYCRILFTLNCYYYSGNYFNSISVKRPPLPQHVHSNETIFLFVLKIVKTA